VEVGFVRGDDGQYAIEWDALGQALDADAKLFVLCNPQNPLGRVFSRGELERVAEHCLRRDVVICSDEIHCDLVFPGHRHVPIASLSPEVAQRTITLMAPSKTYNLAGSGLLFRGHPECGAARAIPESLAGGWFRTSISSVSRRPLRRIGTGRAGSTRCLPT
jgi:cystathionine beta-lyase